MMDVVATPEPVTGAYPALCTAILNGSLLSQRQAEALFSYVTGMAIVDWRAKAERYPDDAPSYLRSAAEQDARLAECSAAFLAMIAKILSLPEDVVRFEVEGRPAPVARMNFGTARNAMLSSDGTISLSGKPPILSEIV